MISLTGAVSSARPTRWNVNRTAMLEVAAVSGTFLLLVLGVLEIALIVFYAGLLSDGAEKASRFLHDESIRCIHRGEAALSGKGAVAPSGECPGATVSALRGIVCQAIEAGRMSCEPDRLRLAVYRIDDSAQALPRPRMVDEVPCDLRLGGRYLIAVGYDWPYRLMTSRLLLARDGMRVQFQSRSFAHMLGGTLR